MASLTTEHTVPQDNEHTVPQDDPVAVIEALKNTGNQLFVQGKYNKAQEKYTEAIELGSEDPKLYGNRSAAFYHVECYEKALADAAKALQIDPNWSKGYHRQAMAMTALVNLEGAVEAYEAACALEPENGGFQKKLARARQRVAEAAKHAKIRGLKHWLTVFKAQTDVRLRLGVLAYFWNAATKLERLGIFHRFLAIIGGASGALAVGDANAKTHVDLLKEKFQDPEIMSDLPLDNYSDLIVPEQWIAHFTALELTDKGVYFEQMYGSLDEMEKTLVVNDLKFFYHYDGDGDQGEEEEKQGKKEENKEG
jgi:tetratricopeptide (TPR) repeat protein